MPVRKAWAFLCHKLIYVKHLIAMLTLTIPKQYEGAQSDNSFSIKANNMAQAKQLYARAKENLLQVNSWGKLAGGLSARFQLINHHGDALYREARANDFIKIKLPVAGKNYDWVQIEAIQETQQENNHQISMRVRPANDPQSTEKHPEHFFTTDATSSFIIERIGERVTAAVRGRNELPNMQTDNFLQKIRNAIIGLVAMLGLNKPQWKALAKGFLTKRIGRAR